MDSDSALSPSTSEHTNTLMSVGNGESSSSADIHDSDHQLARELPYLRPSPFRRGFLEVLTQRMASKELDVLDDHLKTVIQDLYEIQSATHGYLGPETQQVLVKKTQDLVHSLQELSTVAASLPTQAPPEVADYVQTGRNPDIYTREFVELIQRNKSHLQGKSEALLNFRDVLAEEISRAWPELKEPVQDVLDGKGAKMPAGENGVKEEEGERENGVAGSERT